MKSFDIVTAGGNPDFLDLPWDSLLEDWHHPRLVKMAHGRSRHVVRFVRYDHRVYALKHTDVKAARDEYRVLRDLHKRHLPVVEPVAVVTDSPTEGSAVLITRYLDFSLPYWYVIGREDPHLAERLIDAGVVLVVRLHLDGVFWGDCSLSNILWRRDAGAMMAYLVDAETSERHDTISDAMRLHDVEIAKENILGGLMDLQAMGRASSGVDPLAIAESLEHRYDELWRELTLVESFSVNERWRIENRVRRINDLGFDVEELSINTDGETLSIKPVLVDEGHHARELRRRTGLEVQENQARRLLADIEQYRAWLERGSDASVPAAVAAARWLAEVYAPAVEAIPEDLSARLEPAEIFHSMLDHRYLMSEKQGRGVSNEEALADYITTVLALQTSERQLDIDHDSAGDPGL